MDVNVVHPTSPTTCSVKFDWWIEDHLASDDALIRESLAASDRVQQEDIALCERVQRGVQSAGFRPGRYAPALEATMFHFHQLLHARYAQA
jgi:choline monooxygenase